MLREFLKDLVRYLPSTIVPGLFGVGIIPVLTRLLGPTDYGHYVIVTSTVSVLTIVGGGWISPSVIRFYSVYKNDLQKVTFRSTVLTLILLSTFLLGGGSLLAFFFLRRTLGASMYYYLQIGTIVFAALVAYEVMQQMLQVMRKPSLFSLFHIWRSCVAILIGICFVTFFDMGVAGLLLGTAISLSIMLPIMFSLTIKETSVRYYSKELATEFGQYGFPLIAANLANWIIHLSDRYVIEFSRGAYEVGVYSVSFTVVDRSMQLLISLIVLASAPIAVHLWETKGPAETGIFIKDLTKAYLILALPAVVGVALLSELLIHTLTTKGYHDGYKIIPMIAAGVFIFGLQRNFQLGLLFFKKTNVIMGAVLISGLVSVGLNILFVPKYGFVAAGYINLISYFVFAFLIITASRKYFVWPFPYKSLLRAAISSAVMGLAVLGTLRMQFASAGLTIIVAIPVGILVYFSSLVILGEINKNEFTKLTRLFAKPGEGA